MSATIRAELAAQRSQTYWLLSRLFLELPNAALLEALDRALRSAHSGADACESAPLAASIDAALSSPQALTDLQVEFTRLMRGVAKSSSVPEPYESMVREGRLFGDVTEAVAAAYLDAGYQDIVPDAGPPDHVGTELRFMSQLCFREMQAWAQGCSGEAQDWARRQQRFMDHHLLRWVPGHCEQIARSAHETFYATVASMAADACRRDGQDVAFLAGVH